MVHIKYFSSYSYLPTCYSTRIYHLVRLLSTFISLSFNKIHSWSRHNFLEDNRGLKHWPISFFFLLGALPKAWNKHNLVLFFFFLFFFLTRHSTIVMKIKLLKDNFFYFIFSVFFFFFAYDYGNLALGTWCTFWWCRPVYWQSKLILKGTELSLGGG
jgi:hypothetical protein